MSNTQTKFNSLARMVILSDQEIMNACEWISNENYDPNRLLDGLIEKLHLENDAALASKLQLNHRLITMIRERTLTISASMLMLIQDMAGMQIQELRALLTAAQEEQSPGHGGHRP
jgi:hypothetical protein